MDNKTVESPALIAFELTGRCPLNCIHCRAATGPDGQLQTDQCQRIINAVANYCCCTMILTGGEPTERSDLLDLIEFGSARGLRMAMASCGHKIDLAMAEGLKAVGLRMVAFSIDGSTPDRHDQIRGTKGAFELTIKAIEHIKAAGIPFQVNTTITRLNVEDIPAIAQLAVTLQAVCFNPFILVPTGRARQIVDQLLDPRQYRTVLKTLYELRSKLPLELRVTCGPQFVKFIHSDRRGHPVHGCLGGIRFAFISRTGELQPCGFLELSAGNLIKNDYDFRGLWEGSSLFAQLRNRQNITGHCQGCRWLNGCGGCRARAMAVCGDHLAGDPICMVNRSMAQ